MSDSKVKFESFHLKRFENNYRFHQLEISDSIHAKAQKNIYMKYISGRYSWLKEERLPDLDKELEQKENNLIELICNSVEQRILAEIEVTDFEYQTWLGQKSQPFLSEIREAVFKATELEADQINLEWKSSLESELVTLKKRKRELEIEVDAVKDWSAMQKKKFE